MGGWFNSFEPPPRDVWSSADGRIWDQVERQAPWILGPLGPTTQQLCSTTGCAFSVEAIICPSTKRAMTFGHCDYHRPTNRNDVLLAIAKLQQSPWLV